MAKRKKDKPIELGAVRKKLISEQVADTLRTYLQDKGNALFRLPSIARLSEQLGVSVVNVHRAISILEAEKMVEVVHGKGVFTRPVAREVPDMKGGPAIGVVCYSERVAFDYLSSKGGFYSDLLRGVTQAAGDQGYGVALHWIPTTIKDNPRQWADTVDFVKDRNVKGLLLLCLMDVEFIQWLIERVSPCLLLDHWAEGVKIDTMNPDNFMAAHAAARFLCESGHRKVAYIFHRKKSLNPPRLDGYVEAMETLGDGYSDERVRFAELHERAGAAAVLDLLEKGVEFDALMTFDAGQAQGARSVLDTRNLSMPIVTFGGGGEVAVGDCTLVDMQPKTLGVLAVKRLLARLATPDLPTEDLLSPVRLNGREVPALTGRSP